MTTKTYRGSCHCGEVKYEVDLDLSAGSHRCNCSYCTKSGIWGVTVKPAAFRMLSEPKHLGDYSRSEYGHHRFCARCGIRTHGHGNIPELGGEYVSVNLRVLDGVELGGIPVRYLDGRSDTWEERAVIPHHDPFARANTAGSTPA